MLFELVFSHRVLKKVRTSLRLHDKGKCALFCHLPPPFHKWHDFLTDRCEPATSLFIDIDTGPYKKGHMYDGLTSEDVAQVADFLTFTHEGSSEVEKKIAKGYQILKADLDLVLDIVFGMPDLFESGKQGQLVTRKDTSHDDETKCLAFVALHEVTMLYKRSSIPNPDEYWKRRSKCNGNHSLFVTYEQIEQAKVRFEKSLPRTKLIASNAGNQSGAAGPLGDCQPGSLTRGTLEECLASQFVTTTSWDLPQNLSNLFDNVIFMGCNQLAFDLEGKAVEAAIKLVSVGGDIIVSGLTPQNVKLTNGFNGFAFFDKLSDGWKKSRSEGLTVFSKPKKSFASIPSRPRALEYLLSLTFFSLLGNSMIL